MSTDTLQVRPLAGTLAARVDGIDLTEPTPQLGDTIRELLNEHKVLFFHPPSLSDEQQVAVLDLLGGPYIHPLAVVAGKTQAGASRIIDDAEHPPFQDEWHTDVTFDPEPPNIGSLRCIEMPERGGNTIWADMHAAYDGLSPLFRERLEGLNAEHDMGRGLGFSTKGGQELYERARALYNDTPHPVIGTHPVTGKKFVNVNRGFTRRIAGMSPPESTALLEVLFKAGENPNVQYRHQWTEGEFCMWDERATMHYAVADHFPNRREMVRYVVR